MTRLPRLHHDSASIQASVRHLPRPDANPGFRSSLRTAFASRSIPERHAPSFVHWLRERRSAWAACGVAAAAAVIAACWLNTGPAWKIRSASGSGSILLDGRVIAGGSTIDASPAVRAGTRIELPPDAQLDLELSGIVRLQLVGGSRFVMPASPGRWFGRSVVGLLDSGELRITTGPRFEGTRLTIATPEVRATVTGTTFAVFRLPDASCVCVLEGSVSMSEPGTAPEPVPAGFRRVIYLDGRPTLVQPILPMETMKLEMLRSQSAEEQRR